MRRREFLAFSGSAAGLALTPGAARASDGAGRRYRISMVVPRDLGDTETGFQEYLARRNVDAEYVVRTTGGDAARTAAIVAEIETTRPDLVYCWGTPTTLGILGAYDADPRSEEHTSELQSLMRISYAVFCLKKKNNTQ